MLVQFKNLTTSLNIPQLNRFLTAAAGQQQPTIRSSAEAETGYASVPLQHNSITASSHNIPQPNKAIVTSNSEQEDTT